ncbi:MAG: acyl-CoA dehydrogenase family protein [Bryobacteraceae bacterium]
MARFAGVDYMEFDSLLSEQELLARQMARQFVDEQVRPVIRDAYNQGVFPKQLIGQLGELGFLGSNLEGTPS